MVNTRLRNSKLRAHGVDDSLLLLAHRMQPHPKLFAIFSEGLDLCT